MAGLPATAEGDRSAEKVRDVHELSSDNATSARVLSLASDVRIVGMTHLVTTTRLDIEGRESGQQMYAMR